MTKVTKSFQGSDLQPLTQGLRGEVDPWETLPLNNPPLLTALEITTWPTYGFPIVFLHTLGAEVWFYGAARGAPPRRRPLPQGGGARTENPHKNDLQKQVPSWGLFWRPGRPKRSIVANWAPKITPKWSPKWTQK